jgi:phospholipid/cholesterol/gamma-HCH transport system permease protein
VPIDVKLDATGQSADQRLTLSGSATLADAASLAQALDDLRFTPGTNLAVDLSGLTAFDTSAAWLVHRAVRRWEEASAVVTLNAPSEAQARLLALARAMPEKAAEPHRRFIPLTEPLAEMGRGTVQIINRLGQLLAFLGLVMMRFLRLMLRPWELRWNAVTTQFEQIGWQALPIVGLMSFLIGLVLVQQGAFQLRRFGAEIFVVDLVSISTLRELGVLLTAIMVAGRSGSAFAAQIGSMKINEEVDAMRTIGLDPVDVLVIPRLMALVIVMPILAFFACALSLVGGALFGWLSLDIPVETFVLRFQETVTMDDFLVGMIKAPVFGFIIAVVGCFEGMEVEGSASSVGEHTTLAVVQAIFLVIVLDAFFAIFFTLIGM